MIFFWINQTMWIFLYLKQWLKAVAPLLFHTFLAGRFLMFPPFPGTGPEPLCVLLLQSQQREHNITKKTPLSKNSAGTASDAPKQTNKKKKDRQRAWVADAPNSVFDKISTLPTAAGKAK